MIFQATNLSLGSYFSNLQTDGCSLTAINIGNWVKDIKKELKNTEFHYSLVKKVQPQLSEGRESTATPGWDGYGAEPISGEAYYYAEAFLESLPNDIPVPTVGAEPDGFITLEWYRSPRWILSVSVGARGDLHYAALFGLDQVYGTVRFFDTTPKIILDLIRRVSTV
jgi:hypothetical protein